MTKSKTKEIPEACYNCIYSDFSGDVYDQGGGIFYPEFKCELNKKKHHAEYVCKKWKLQEMPPVPMMRQQKNIMENLQT